MSAEAAAYVMSLRECPDGAGLNCFQKCLLFVLADHHNRSTRRCDPSHELLIEESLTSRCTVKRILRYLEDHLVITVTRPANQGRGQRSSYTFLALDNPAKLEELLAEKQKGAQTGPLFREAKGAQKGLRLSFPIRKEPGTGIEPGTGRARGPTKVRNPPAFDPWEKVLCRLREDLDESSFATWLQPTRLSHIADGVLFVRVPSRDFNVITERYGDRISDALRRLGYDFSYVELINEQQHLEDTTA